MTTDEGVLVVGFGNPMRGDDALGWRVAELLADDDRLAGTRVMIRHQLTPELAVDFALSRLVVLIDARMDGDDPAGTVRTEWLSQGASGPTSMSHAVAPKDVVGLTVELYGACPPVAVVSVSAERFDDGEPLSAALTDALPTVVETVFELSGVGRT